MNKRLIRKNRLPDIIDILSKETIHSQNELLNKLALRGHNIAQATLSRDLKILNVTKEPDHHGRPHYKLGLPQLNNQAKTEAKTTYNISSLRSYILSIRITGNIVVIRTRKGYANGLAYYIDTLASDLVLGTIPGTDTVFVAVKEQTPRIDIFNLFCTFVPPQIMSDAHASFMEA